MWWRTERPARCPPWEAQEERAGAGHPGDMAPGTPTFRSQVGGLLASPLRMLPGSRLLVEGVEVGLPEPGQLLLTFHSTPPAGGDEAEVSVQPPRSGACLLRVSGLSEQMPLPLPRGVWGKAPTPRRPSPSAPLSSPRPATGGMLPPCRGDGRGQEKGLTSPRSPARQSGSRASRLPDSGLWSSYGLTAH